MAKSVLLILVMCCSAILSAADRIDRMVWHNKPLPMTLPVNKGITVYLPEGDWAVGLPAALNGVLDHYETANILYLTARSEFTTQLMPVKNIDTEQQILILLSAKGDAQETDFGVIDGAAVDADKESGLKGKNTDITKALTRHAAMSLYAPKRLQPSNPLIRSFPVMNKPLTIFNHALNEDDECIPTNDLSARPIYAWRSGSHYVTAVRIENKSQSNITIDPRGCHIKGDFLTTTAQHQFVEPKYKNGCEPKSDSAASRLFGMSSGSVDDAACVRSFRDVTTLYLTSNRPFWEVVQP